MNDSFQAIDGYDRTKTPRMLTVRELTATEAKQLIGGYHTLVVCNDKKIRNVKINGAPKTWKTRPNDVDVPLKYGMYEYAKTEYRNGARTYGPMLVKETE